MSVTIHNMSESGPSAGYRITSFLRQHCLRILSGVTIACFLADFLINNLDTMTQMLGKGFSQRLAIAYWALTALAAVGAVFPVAGGIGVSLLTAVCLPLFWGIRQSPFAMYDPVSWSVAWLIGMMAKESKTTISLPCCLIVCFSFVTPRYRFVPLAGIMIPDIECVIECVAAFSVGYALRLNVLLRRQSQLEREADRLRNDSERLKRLEHNARIQRMIHDSVTSELTYVVLLTRPSYTPETLPEPNDTNLGKTTDPRISIIHEHALLALQQTRKAIKLLLDEQKRSSSDQPIFDTPTMSNASRTAGSSFSARRTIRLEDRAARHDNKLRDLGFHGKTTIVCAKGNDDEVARNPEICDLLDELYANIATHGKCNGGWFSCTMVIEDHELRIRCENDIDIERPVNAVFSSGTGLKRQREYIHQCGSSMDTFTENGVFGIFVELPIKSYDSVESRPA